MPFRDLAYASRTLRHSPVFTLTAIVTLALGVGASAAIFSVTNAVLLKPLPYRDADRLVAVTGELRVRNVKDWPFSHADFIDLNQITAQKYDDMGPAAVEPLFGDPHTHTTVAGAVINAQSVVAGLKNLPDDPVKNDFSAKGGVIAPYSKTP